MSTTEIEPWAARTLSLLGSKTDESVEQMKIALEESIRAKFGPRWVFKPIPGPWTSKSVDEKKIKSESKKKLSIQESSESCTGSESSDDHLAREILEDDLACVICREMAIGPRNRLVECAECHSLYHQECHSPSISELDVSDPRLVWYCSQCNKTVVKPKTSSSSSSSKPAKSSSASRASQGSPVTNFNSKSFGGSSHLLLGLSGSSKKSSSSKSSSNSSNNNKTVASNIISADKRLQIMKKRAAKKQEKRVLTK